MTYKEIMRTNNVIVLTDEGAVAITNKAPIDKDTTLSHFLREAPETTILNKADIDDEAIMDMGRRGKLLLSEWEIDI